MIVFDLILWPHRIFDRLHDLLDEGLNGLFIVLDMAFLFAGTVLSVDLANERVLLQKVMLISGFEDVEQVSHLLGQKKLGGFRFGSEAVGLKVGKLLGKLCLELVVSVFRQR